MDEYVKITGEKMSIPQVVEHAFIIFNKLKDGLDLSYYDHNFSHKTRFYRDSDYAASVRVLNRHASKSVLERCVCFDFIVWRKTIVDDASEKDARDYCLKHHLNHWITSGGPDYSFMKCEVLLKKDGNVTVKPGHIDFKEFFDTEEFIELCLKYGVSYDANAYLKEG